MICDIHANKRDYFCLFYIPFYFVEEKKGESGTTITVIKHRIASMLCNSNVSSVAAPEGDDIHVVTNVLPSKDSSSGKLYYQYIWLYSKSGNVRC